MHVAFLVVHVELGICTFCRGPPMIQSMEGSLGVRKGAWTEEEDILLRQCVEKHGEGKWCQIPLRAGLNRCRKSCRLRWLNYLKPNIKRGGFTGDEVDLLIRLHKLLGNRWSLIAGRLPGRTANDVKNYWNTHLRKKANSCDKDAKEKAEDIVKVNVIKPRPRTFTKSLTCLSGKPAVVKSFEPKDNVSSISPALMASDSKVKWWESLLDDKEGDEGATCATSALDKEPNRDLWAEKIAPEAKGGDSFDVDGTSCLADFSFDDDGTSFFTDFSFETSLWKFLNAD